LRLLLVKVLSAGAALKPMVLKRAAGFAGSVVLVGSDTFGMFKFRM